MRRFCFTDALVVAFVVSGITQSCFGATEGNVAAGHEASGDGALTPESAARSVPMPPSLLPFEDHNVGYYFSLGLTAAFPDDLEVSDYCLSLLRIFGERYVNYVKCLVSYTRPVAVCENCYKNFNNLQEIYLNISSDAVSVAVAVHHNCEPIANL